ncbi:MAG: DNA polymerase III subunit beta [Rhodospirillales bacterium]|nr:DNA polymerase III subunit beta [Rhodospirillales bacterium]
MKVTIERAQLLKSLGHAQSVVERRNTIPILSNIKMQAECDELRLTATDMDIEIVESVPAVVIAAGATTVPAHTLYDIVRKLPDGAQIELESSSGGERLTLRCGRSRFALACLPIEDFPALTGSELPFRFRLAAADVRSLIDRTRFAISTEETRYYLNGIYLHTVRHDSVDVLRAVATDGHRLARVELPVPAGAQGMAGVIIPRKTVSEVRKIVDEASEEVEIALSETQIRFGIGPALLTSKLIDGTFPDYERVIPEHNDKQLDVVCRDFKSAVDRVSAISNDRTRAVKLKLANGVLELSANSPEHGSATEELEVQYEGEAMEIGFNSRYLLDIADQIGGDNARLSMADAASPTILHELDDRSAIYVLMPMRV